MNYHDKGISGEVVSGVTGAVGCWGVGCGGWIFRRLALGGAVPIQVVGGGCMDINAEEGLRAK